MHIDSTFGEVFSKMCHSLQEPKKLLILKFATHFLYNNIVYWNEQTSIAKFFEWR